MSKASLVALRSKHVNTITAMSDGTSYGGVGGGTNSAGMSATAVVRADQMLELVCAAEQHLRDSIDQVSSFALEAGRPLPSSPRFELAFHDGHICGFEPTVKLLVRLLPQHRS
jgi:hypothetical protein